ncbi:MAG: TonB-dependent receptor [Gammaproteobacteria bacterium]
MNRLSEISLAVRRALPMKAIASTSRIMLTLAVTSAAAIPAFAQEAATEPTTVVVTGSRIPAPNLESASPVQVVTAEEIQLGGRMDISDVINQLPQNFSNGLGQDLGNNTSGLTTAGGVSTADLRGLGPNRTLVLVNGRRLGVGSPYTVIQSPAPNLDQIPTFLLERVDVVTGGASAVYGSDAIAGVINFITKQNFEGFQIDYHVGENFYHNDSSTVRKLAQDADIDVPTGTSKDGRTQTINVMAGTNIADGAGNITAYFSYHMANPVPSSNRDFGSCQLNYDKASDQPICAGSANSNFFSIDGDTVYSVLGNQFIEQGTAPTNPPALFNSQPFIFMSRDDRRYMAGFMGHLDLNDSVKPYMEFHFMNDQTHQEIAPSALFIQSNPNDPQGNGNYNINCSNPLLSAQQRGILCSPADIAADTLNPGTAFANTFVGRRNIEGGGRTSDYEHTSYRAVGGLKGSLGKAWSYDAYGQYYYVDFFNSNNKYLNFANIDKALNVTGTAANPVCVSGPPCVPYNIFTDGGVTQAQVDYLSLNGTARGTSTLRTLHGDITGDLGEYGIKLPTADTGVGVNFGYEKRTEDLVFAPDAAEQSGQLAGFGGAPVAIDKSQTVDEEFIEVRVPLVADKPFVKDLTFDTGFRHSDYSVTGKINTHKFELLYAPVSDVRFRATFQRAVRAPSLIELFNPQAIGLIAFGTDPCGPTRTTDPDTGVITVHPPAATRAQCANTGLSGALYDGGIPQTVASQATQLSGGTTTLQAETSNSYTVGFTFTPTFLPNFVGSLDYYNIKLKGGIGVFPADVIMNQCLQTGNPTFCSQIVRNTSNGSLNGPTQITGGYIIQTNLNLSTTLLKGIDAQLSYRLPVAEHWGDLTFTLNGAYLMKNEQQPAPGVAKYDCAGLFGSICQTVNPEWHHVVRTTWETPWNNLAISLNWRYLGKVSLDQNEDNPTLHFARFGQRDGFNARIPAYHYLDLAGSWGFRDDMTLRFGVNNIADKNPPIVTSEIVAGGDANTYSAYDQFGRQAFVAVTMKF